MLCRYVDTFPILRSLIKSRRNPRATMLPRVRNSCSDMAMAQLHDGQLTQLAGATGPCCFVDAVLEVLEDLDSYEKEESARCKGTMV